jgi:DNA polymerase-3 subunit gamma/tau
MPLHTDHRPKTFKFFIGNKDVVDSLKVILKRDDIPPAFLFTGEGGTGKTTMANIIRHALKCSDTDYTELNAADDRGINAIRALRENMRFAPLAGEKKVILLDEAHMLTKEAQEALLKMLEKPPEYIHFIVATTNPEKLKPTFKRRCHHYHLQPAPRSEMLKLLRLILKREKVTNFPQKVLNEIEELADGSAGQALKLLDQVIDMDDEKKAISVLQTAGNDISEIIDICRALMDNLPAKTKSNKIRKLLTGYYKNGGDAESARYAILGYMNSVLLRNGDTATAMIIDYFKESFMYSGKAGLTQACIYACYDDED